MTDGPFTTGTQCGHPLLCHRTEQRGEDLWAICMWCADIRTAESAAIERCAKVAEGFGIALTEVAVAIRALHEEEK